ncbi:acyl-CoA dehydrogenase [Burkholderia sp. JP2-270]|uniref:acyl-CoA dehydrogenase family protein n=1 Tax=Burkholderia sp. JP2-270 TaxID=2217913 RepID=UPI000DA3F36B|nr:acyl-CoA dehydrogenase family protein [Burkholderia sp. JP2-270]AWV02643.1 acyl-CoA dehydrogenase [Burkholderia sp. JP2-270]
MTTTKAKVKFDPLDPLLLTRELSDDENTYRGRVRAFATDVLMPRVRSAFRHEHEDRAIFREMGAHGLFGCMVPEQYGGEARNAVCYGVASHEIERVDSGYRSLLTIQASLVIFPILHFGSDAQRERYLPKLVSGEWVGCFGMTEANLGSDPGAMQTRAVKVPGGYRLIGEKNWITNAPIADVLVVWAKAEDGSVLGFIVERDAVGLSTPVIEGKMALRASTTGKIVLDDVMIPDAQVLPGVKRLSDLFSCLNSARYGISWGALGAAAACYETARDYTLARSQFGRPLAANQLIQKKFADMLTEISLGMLGCLRFGRMTDDGIASVELTSILKRNSCGKALDIARVARDMLGGNGISDEYCVIRHLLNLEVVNTYEGTHDIHALVLGKAITGLSAFAN